MLGVVIGVIILVIATAMAPFIILLTVNMLLVRKLRSIIPLSPGTGPAAARPGPQSAEKAESHVR